jgi:hypothetical protein
MTVYALSRNTKNEIKTSSETRAIIFWYRDFTLQVALLCIEFYHFLVG